MSIWSYIITGACAYLLGSIPTGYLVGRLKGIDIRQIGSGNIGATNVFRILGKPAGIFVLIVDGLKGYAGCAWLALWIVEYFITQVSAEVLQYHMLVGGVCAVLGHNYTCWLRFRGGKGVATSAGVLAGLNGTGFILTLGTWILVLALFRYVSLASIVAAAAMPLAFWACGASLPVIVMTALMGIMAIIKHRANIQRLLAGTENRFGSKKPAQPNPGS